MDTARMTRVRRLCEDRDGYADLLKRSMHGELSIWMCWMVSDAELFFLAIQGRVFVSI